MAVDIKKSSAAITEKFKQTKSELEAFFDVPPQIYHVGSTAVPGVDGKNILDILISANDSQHMNQIKTRLLAAGYFPSQKPSARPDYLFLASRTEETGEGDIHIHIAIAGTETHDDFLTLRDYLRSRKDEAARYSAAKYTYASQAKFDRSTYKRLKSAYVDEILKRARNWQTQCCDSVKF